MRFSPSSGFYSHLPPIALALGSSHEVPSPSALWASGVRFSPGFPNPDHVPTSGFHTLLPVFSSRRLPGLFRPGGTPGVHALQGFSLSRSRATSSVSALPSWRLFPPGLGSHGVAVRGRPRPARLEFAAEPFSPSRRLASRRVRALQRSHLRPPGVDPLLGFLLPTVFPSSVGGTDFAAPPLSRFPRLGLFRVSPKFSSPTAPQSLFPQTRWRCLSRGRLTVSRFPASELRAFLACVQPWLIASPRAPGDVSVPCGPSTGCHARRPE
jgi:hypothetical protein